MRFFFQIAICLLVAGDAAAQTTAPVRDRDMQRIAEWMIGDFDTFAQVDRDEEEAAAYKHARALLRVRQVGVSGLPRGVAFYVENQLAEAREKPYRQRVYFLMRDAENRLTMQIYRIANEADFVNAHRKPEIFKDLTFDNLKRETGCDLVFERVNARLYRAAAGENRSCKSALRGATHTVSRTELSPEQWINLDQGFDDAGSHKWGPPPGTVGHIFLKRKTVKTESESGKLK